MREEEEEDIADGWEGKALPAIGIVFISFIIHELSIALYAPPHCRFVCIEPPILHA
jgi:hypothetical protein